jgi:cytochrome P450
LPYHGSPLHEAIRHAEGGQLRPRAVQQLTDFVRELVRDRLDELVPRGQFDLTQEFGGMVAASVQCHMFRMPLDQAKFVLETVNAGSKTDANGEGIQLGERRKLYDALLPIVRRRREEGPDGSFPMVDGLLAFRYEDRPLTDGEITQFMGHVITGGTETVPKVIAQGLWELFKRPDQLAAVRADLGNNAGKAFREMVRYCGPAQWFIRTVQRPAMVGGVQVGTGQRVLYLIPSAARDPREYGDDADEFRWDRDIRRWVNFGWGMRFCIGYHLALLEGGLMVEEFLRQVEDIDVLLDQVERPPSSFQWGYTRLPIRVTPAQVGAGS